MIETINKLNPLYIDKNIRCLKITNIYEGTYIYYLVNISEEERLNAIKQVNKQVPRIALEEFPEHKDNKYWINERFLIQIDCIEYYKVWKDNPDTVFISETPEEFESRCVNFIKSVMREMKKDNAHRKACREYEQRVRDNCSKYKSEMSKEEIDLAYPEIRAREYEHEQKCKQPIGCRIKCLGGYYMG